MLATLLSSHVNLAAHHVSLLSAYSTIYLTFPVLRVKKHQKLHPEAHSSAQSFRGDVSEQKWFVCPSSTVLASLSPSHFIPAAHHVSSFSAYSTIFRLSPCCTSKTSEIVNLAQQAKSEGSGVSKGVDKGAGSSVGKCAGEGAGSGVGSGASRGADRDAGSGVGSCAVSCAGSCADVTDLA